MPPTKFKNILTSQWFRVANVLGFRDGAPTYPTPSGRIPTNFGIDPLGDGEGRLIVKNFTSQGFTDSVITPDVNGSFPASAPSEFTGYDNSRAYVNTLEIYNPGNAGVDYIVYLQEVYGFNIGVTPFWLQLLVTDPIAANDDPIFSILVPASANFSLAPLGDSGVPVIRAEVAGSPFTLCGQTASGNKATLVVSSTGNVYTPVANPGKFWINYVFRANPLQVDYS